MKGRVLFILYSFLILLIMNSCTISKEKESCANKDHESIKIEDFNEFSKLFYSDSLFQISRIIFPLVGDVDGLYSTSTSERKLKKIDWVMLKNNYFKKGDDSVFVFHGEHFKARMHKTNKSVVQEIFIENSGYKSELKFILKNRKWYLIDFTTWNY